MKELTIEQKAKAYDDLIVRLREAKVDNDVCDERYCCVIDDIVPELAESEDVKIRKELIAFLKENHETWSSSGIERWTAWLERQELLKNYDEAEKKNWKNVIEQMESKIGLFFGTFNPIHNGHLAMCNYILENYGFDYIVLVVSPDSPFKEHNDGLLSFDDRVLLCKTAILDDRRLTVSTIEDKLPHPTYTHQTLEYYKSKYGNCNFTLIIGGDNLIDLVNFANVEYILSNFKILVCPRGCIDNLVCEKHIQEIKEKYKDSGVLGIEVVENMPEIGLSSTFIRNEVSQGNSIRYYVPDSIKKSVEIKYGKE